jgi:murein DD-endopeptidase MepM/ murein hydrolase activator NlpD
MRAPARRRNAAALTFVTFCAGVGVGWWLHAGPPAPAIRFEEPRPVAEDPIVGVKPSTLADVEPPPASPVATMGAGPISVLEMLRERDLRLPLDGVDIETFKHSFAEQRRGGRTHEAADILAPRHTPVRAVDDGTIAKLFLSKAGGITIYQFDPWQRFTYYYAHLERYADGLTEAQPVKRGEVIGYVGTSGNAPPNTPHLHFAIFELTADRRWWQGTPIDPYRVFHE